MKEPEMLKEAFGTGATVEAAKEAAMLLLDAPADIDVQFEIVDMPAKKTFGFFGGNPAKVRVFYEEIEEEVPEEEKAQKYLRGILSGMGLEGFKITAIPRERGTEYNIEGQDIGIIIGRRGETLDAIQYLTGLVANRNRSEYTRVTLNIGNYREKREGTLQGLAKKVAQQVIRNGRSSTLEPMNPYERRIIHTQIQGMRGVTSWSVGDEPTRCVVVGVERHASSSGKHYNRDDSRGDRKPGGYSGQKRYDRDRRDNRDNRDNRDRDRERPVKTPSREPRSDAGATAKYGKVTSKRYD